MQYVFAPKANTRYCGTVVHWLDRAICAFKGRPRGPVIVEQFGDWVVEDAVSSPVDRDPVCGYLRHFVVIDGAAWRAGGGGPGG